MPWVRLDDRFPSHRKVSLLSDRAFRLHVSALCWCAENLTDGKIRDEELRLVAHVRSMTATAKELVSRDVWERLPDGWQIHDYLDYNKSAEQVRAERADNAARQQEYRDKRKANAAAKAGASRATSKIERNGVTNGVTNGGSNWTPEPAPVPAVPPNGGTASKQGSGLAVPLAADDIPAQARPLVDGLSASGVVVRWPFRGNQWFPVLALITDKGIPAMTTCARQIAARVSVESANYFMGAWGDLPPLPAPGSQLTIPASPNVVPLPSPATTRNQAARAGYAALAEELAQTQPGSTA